MTKKIENDRVEIVPVVKTEIKPAWETSGETVWYMGRLRKKSSLGWKPVIKPVE
jgi:hypothetical protein